jgi:hypothetical protein
MKEKTRLGMIRALAFCAVFTLSLNQKDHE